MHLTNGKIKMDTKEIVAKFNTAGTIGDISIHGGGHINDSYHLVNTEAGDFLSNL